jgi:hypothetical protein
MRLEAKTGRIRAVIGSWMSSILDTTLTSPRGISGGEDRTSSSYGSIRVALDAT